MQLSIITVNRNNALGLEKTIQSVICQEFCDYEYIVIDGKSDDNSVNIIAKYQNKIDYWTSEADTGIYNAMNKGIKKAIGEYCLFLNSGDYLISAETLKNVFEEIDGMATIYYSDLLTGTNTCIKYPDNIKKYLLFNAINHQNSIIKRDLFLEHGFYNEENKFISDWEFFLKEAWIYKNEFSYLKTKIAIYDLSGITSAVSLRQLLVSERNKIYWNVFGDLAEIVIEIANYRSSLYVNIINNFGNTKILEFILRFYRFSFYNLHRIVRFFRNNFRIANG
jgi:glycosyltransferase involved in cell wall biosynthesis